MRVERQAPAICLGPMIHQLWAERMIDTAESIRSPDISSLNPPRPVSSYRPVSENLKIML